MGRGGECIGILGAAMLAAACAVHHSSGEAGPETGDGSGESFAGDSSVGEADASRGGVGDAATRPGEATTFAQWGEPRTFDPEQVYVHGRLAGSEFAQNVYAEPCRDGVSAIADWSSPKDDWRTSHGVTVALPCEIRDARVRADGSILYEIAQFAVRVFRQEDPAIDAERIVLPDSNPETNVGDPEVLICGREGFRHWLHPVTGTALASCEGEDGALVYVSDEGPEPDIPQGFTVVHLGFGEKALVQSIASRDDLRIWNQNALTPLGVLPFDPTDIAAIRADEDGFVLLVVENEGPPVLTRWHVATTGEVTRHDDYPDAPGTVLDVSNCMNLFAPPFTPSPAPARDLLRSAGCACALEPSGAALCIARTGDAPIVLRFEVGAAGAQVVFRPADDRFLIDVKGLLTGT